MEFNKAYNRQDFVKFLQKDFMPEDFLPMEENVDIDMTYSKQVVKLGYSKSLELVVYEIQHNSKNDARVSLSKEAFRILANEAEYRALVIFVPQDNNDNYRLSLIEMTLESKDDSSRITYCYSNPRRYSYLIGTSIEGLRTIDEYLLCKKSEDDKIKRVIDYDDLRNRFSVEKLATDFYKDLQNWFGCALDVVSFPNDLDDPEDDDKYNAESIIRLITRLIFVWFLKQKNLVPKEFFDEKYIADNLLKDFSPNEQFGLFGQKSLESKYYKAILQNLFFAMLNSPITKEGKTELSERHFRKLTDKGRPSDSDFNDNKLMRYESLFKNPQLFVDLANQTVPFLNGGLFDCLDKKRKRFYLDGFSDKAEVKKALVVPDYLFFSDDIVADLSTFYNDKKKYNEHVTGIIKIFRRYNFTIEENTPFDKEVSLDPELLGKVFENLLASYNPETHTTARKQTGSFYTPREIVQYMVDESLVAHLKRVVGSELEDEYRKLLRYTDEELLLTDEQKYGIMSAIYNCKVLDPACGSGAFPVGMLQQMVHILSQLDPSNDVWKQMVLDEAVKESRNAFLAETLEEREQRLNEINETFEDQLKNPDYKRKLYLIENCLYGVDIQSIAIQICKLRFFISLVVDQKTNNKPEDNFGIRPLPNLEAKFVAANTLIGLNKKNDFPLFDNEQVKEKMQEMKEINHKIFYLKHKAKEKHQTKIQEIKSEIANLLKENGIIGNEEVQQLQTWDRFDQNSSSPFFDSELMFGEKDGFDIVIGNPPYVQVPTSQKHLYLKYPAIEGRIDLYELFIQKSMMLLTPKGVLTFITPNTVLSNLYTKKLRRLMIEKYGICEISNFGMDVFDTPIVHTCILRMLKGIKIHQIGIKKSIKKINDIFLPFDYFLSIDDVVRTKNYTFDITLNSAERDLFNKLNSFTSLGEICYIRQCIKTGNDKEYVKLSTIKLPEPWKNALRGKSIEKYCIKESTLYIKYGKWLARNWANKSFYERPKIAIREAGKNITACLDDNNSYLLSSLYSLYPKTEYTINDLKIILGFINSKLATFYVTKVAFDLTEGAFTKMRTNQLSRLPLNSDMFNHNEILEIVDSIINIKRLDYFSNTLMLEQKIDKIFYHLYGLTYDEVLIVDPRTPITREEYEKDK